MKDYKAEVTLRLEAPDAMHWSIIDVLKGEYESGFHGSNLDILDIGANVGSFAIWASMRYPGSRITSYEPNPGTFAMLRRNVEGRPGITPVQAALFPGGMTHATYVSRFAGDGEGGLETYMRDTFVEGAQAERHEVAVIDPASLPSADLVKIDIEGGEGPVLAALDLTRTALVLAEFQNRKNLEAIEAVLASEFETVHRVVHPWDGLVGAQGYRADLAGDVFGNIYAARRGQTRLTRGA